MTCRKPPAGPRQAPACVFPAVAAPGCACAASRNGAAAAPAAPGCHGCHGRATTEDPTHGTAQRDEKVPVSHGQCWWWAWVLFQAVVGAHGDYRGYKLAISNYRG